jgi:AbrB family looped-hinge helix DNA binding protein
MALHETSHEPDRYTVEIGAKGQPVLPAAVREKLSLATGDRVVLSVENDGSMRLVSLRDQVRQLKGMLRDIAPGHDLADELIRERREESRRSEHD